MAEPEPEPEPSSFYPRSVAQQDALLAARHPGVASLLGWLTPNPGLPAGLPSAVAEACHELAYWVVVHIDDDPELTDGLRELLRAKDAFVRAAITHQSQRSSPA